MHRLIIEPEAEADIGEARDWYEQQREGLSDDFDLCLDAGMQTIQRHPKAFQIVYKKVRRFMISRFPYLILFTVRGDAVIVIAVFHVRRDPAAWQERVK
jgi:plasmid stabilization system protein ParE